ncbi:HNH endonuclease signature motif containing protein [Endozoicomonas acroporae]|uniref:HNH endonuclease signature motif containing protein n=1 Tax=Endozoicomonas acroporae TaxID=1701104 RepID=UPI000C76E220|nr:HNH endonuclease signature motif containing protein [Endozoicomonas acroporae]
MAYQYASYKYPFEGVEEEGKRAVWNKGKKIIQNGKEYDSNLWRWDMCGNVMKYSEHGNTDSEHGWEIDHIRPSSKGGTDDLDNLQPLQWENNRRKGDTFPWSCQ